MGVFRHVLTSRTLSLIVPSPSWSKAWNAPAEREKNTKPLKARGRQLWPQEKVTKQSRLCSFLFKRTIILTLMLQIGEWTGGRLTEHGFEPNQTADEAVKVDVHGLVCVAHGDDVVQLVVETEAWAGHKTHDCTATKKIRGWVPAANSAQIRGQNQAKHHSKFS